MRKVPVTCSILLALAVSPLVGCAASDDADPVPADEVVESERRGNQRRVRIAWLGSDPANTYDAAILAGVADVAAASRASVTPHYSYFDPALQLDQCLEVVRRRRADALVVIAVDAVGIAPCVAAARARRIPVVAADLPIGPDIATVEPQLPGQAGAVLVPAAAWGAELTPLVVELCAARSPCNVVYLAGSFDVAFDQVALASLEDAAIANPNLQLVAVEQAFYDRGLAYALTQDLLAVHPDVHVVVGAGDQMAQGAEEAIAAAGVPGPIQIIGAGAGGYGIDAVRDGRWYATFLAVPYDEGVLAGELAVDAARCRPVEDAGINPVDAVGLPAFFTADNAEDLADFVPQWPG